MQNAEQQSERHLSEGWPDGWVGRFNLSFCCSYKTAIKFQLNTNSMEKEKKRKEKEKAAYKAACGSLQKVFYLYHSFRRSKSLYFFYCSMAFLMWVFFSFSIWCLDERIWWENQSHVFFMVWLISVLQDTHDVNIFNKCLDDVWMTCKKSFLIFPKLTRIFIIYIFYLLRALEK